MPKRVRKGAFPAVGRAVTGSVPLQGILGLMGGGAKVAAVLPTVTETPQRRFLGRRSGMQRRGGSDAALERIGRWARVQEGSRKQRPSGEKGPSAPFSPEHV